MSKQYNDNVDNYLLKSVFSRIVSTCFNKIVNGPVYNKGQTKNTGQLKLLAFESGSTVFFNFSFSS